MAKRSKEQFFDDYLNETAKQQEQEESPTPVVTDTTLSEAPNVGCQDVATVQTQDPNQEKSSYKDKVLNRPHRKFKKPRELRTERFSLALTKSTFDKLKVVAAARKVSLNAICERLVIEFLEGL